MKLCIDTTLLFSLAAIFLLGLRKIRSFCVNLTTIRSILFILIIAGCKERQVTRPTPEIEVDPQFWIRVLLLNDVNSCTFETGSSFTVSFENSDNQATERQVRFEKIDDIFTIELNNGSISVADVHFDHKQIFLSPESPHIFTLNGDKYRGRLRIIANTDNSSFDVINIVPPEPYLAGVVGAEMPDYWEPEALKAQVIASRSYCFYIKNRFGINRNWDLSNTASNQVYRGVKAESVAVWDAINETKGKVLAYQQGDTDRILPAYYSSTCGGHTEDSINVFGDSSESIIGVECPYCRDIAKTDFFDWKDVQFSKSEVSGKLLERYPALQNLGEIIDVNIAMKSDYEDFSRLTKIELVGTNGEKMSLSAEDFRLSIDPSGQMIKSTSFKIKDSGYYWIFYDGRGWGHGVGMCQCGAEGMARQGKTAKQILEYYYPNSQIITLNY